MADRLNRVLNCYGQTAVFGLTLWIGLAASGNAEAQGMSTTPVRACVYNSRSYSDGAYLCAQRSLMLVCSDDGNRASWKIVAEKNIAERCVAPVAQDFPSRRRNRFHHVRISRPAPVVAAPASAKCFHFNGKRYCE